MNLGVTYLHAHLSYHWDAALVAGVPMSYLLTRGQSIKVFSQLLRKARAKGFLLPNIKVGGLCACVAVLSCAVPCCALLLPAPASTNSSERRSRAWKGRKQPAMHAPHRPPLGLVPPQVTGAPSDGVAYEGATVLDPKTGFYKE